MKHRIGAIVFGLVVGISFAVLSYRWATDPAPRAEREAQERAVQASRSILEGIVVIDDLEIVDALAPNRRIGKTYVYSHPDGWEVSGFYRRPSSKEPDRWHPYLIRLDPDMNPLYTKLADTDPALVERAADDPTLDVIP